jgi:hypothetical protein
MKKKEISFTDYIKTKHEANFELLIGQYLELALIEKMQKDPGYKGLTAKDIKFYAKKDRYFIVDIGVYLWAQNRPDTKPAKKGFIQYVRAIGREINKNILMHGLTGREKEAFIKNQKNLSEDILTDEEGEFIYGRVTKEHPEMIIMVTELYKLLVSGYAFSEALKLCKEIKN